MKKTIIILTVISIFIAGYSYTIKKSDLISYVHSLNKRQQIAQRFFVYAPQHVHFVTEPGGIIPSGKIIKGLMNNDLTKEVNIFEIPPFIGIDQEGGKVNRFHFIAQFPSMYDLAHKVQDSIEFYLDSQLALMKKAEINVNFGPVVDLSMLNGSNMNRMKRNISRRPDSIIAFANFYMDYLKEKRILSTLKHFPGYGNTYYNSDANIYKYKGSLLHFIKEYSIFQALAGKADFVMVSNLIYPFLDSVPAIMSGSIVSLAQQYYSNSIILTDDIACKAYDEPFYVLKQSIIAGNDMFILMDHTLYEPMIDSMYIWYMNGDLDSADTFRGVKKIILKKEYLFRIISNREL